ncbi:glycoside hydrolase family 18 protein [Aspergillus saccharolyticus JOP 1030-1]|uniref:chitinase n=1 Tax=Aspergillus saccharolyticus JOP 1030-1 TaxID=1450539 RepID=A0A318ZS92_9EURO|nr:putative class V chitinase [Aspergillus saccharolyticus JOP 1030-1]PYH49987.1 putative class V chitinase [Aspergillus saccharolyticus JOP 1030-1]
MISNSALFPHWRRKAVERSSSSSYEVPFYLNAAYYPNWRIYQNQSPSSLRLGFVSHIFYAFAWVKEDGTVYLSDEWADTQMPVDGTTGCLRAFAQLKPKYPKLKLILSIGGAGKGSENFARVACSHSCMETFGRTARALVDEYGLDGIDVDWEHPSDAHQGADYVRLLSQIRKFLPTPRYLVTSALPASPWFLRHIDIFKAQTYLDLLNIMTYDFTGPWTSETGHHAQLTIPQNTQPNSSNILSCQSSISYILTNHSINPKKLLLGIPVYGRSFLGCSGPGQPYTGCGGEDGIFDYCDLPRPSAREVVDEEAGAAYCVGGTDGGFVTYDTPRTVQMKAKFVTRMKLGGLFYWHIGGDKKGGKGKSLIEVGYESLHDM